MVEILNKIKVITDIVAEHQDEIPYEVRVAIAVAILDLTVTLYAETLDLTVTLYAETNK